MSNRGSIKLSWDIVLGATYKVHQAESSFEDVEGYELLRGYTSYSTIVTSRLVTDLANGTRYYFVVTALVNGKESPASKEVTMFLEFPQPSKPTNLTAFPSSGTVNLNWDSVEGATNYKVYQSREPRSINSNSSNYTTYNTDDTSIEIKDLKRNTPYYFVVTAFAYGKESLDSDEIGTLPDFPTPPSPTNLKIAQ